VLLGRFHCLRFSEAQEGSHIVGSVLPFVGKITFKEVYRFSLNYEQNRWNNKKAKDICESREKKHLIRRKKNLRQ